MSAKKDESQLPRDQKKQSQEEQKPAPTVIARSNTDKFLLYLNTMLSMENAAIERLHTRIQQCQIPEAKDTLVHHLEETREQKDRLTAIIRDIGGRQQSFFSTPTNERAELARYQPPKILADALEASSTPIERELKTMEADWLIENAEVMGYKTLIQMAQKMGFGGAMVTLRQSLEEEEQMVAWIRANSPAIFGQYWGRMEAEWKRESIVA